jgi:primosomal protein N' (replication factor Y)
VGAAADPEPLVVRVLPDEAAIDKAFDYLVPAEWVADGRAARLRPGTMVRVPLHGRRVGGWVLEVGVTPPPGVRLVPLAKIRGIGPSEELIGLARWAAWRWYGRPATFLGTASPETAVTSLPARPRAVPVPVPVGPPGLVDEVLAAGGGVVRIPPGDDLLPVALAAARCGNALVLAPGLDTARDLAVRLRRAGVPVALHPRDWAAGAAGATVVGARAAAFAPVADLAAVVVLDEGDEAYQEERSPTWNARDVAIERARRAGVPCVLTSPAPTLEALAWRPAAVPSRNGERAGWPVLVTVDRRRDDPARAGLLSERLTPLLRGEGPVVCVLNRTGRSRMLACAACGELARCEHCGGLLVQPEPGLLACGTCDRTRPVVCGGCGGTLLKNLRAGVARVREELEALAGRPVVEVTAATARVPLADVYVGNEAVLQRLPAAGVPSAAVVVFLDVDQELLAPRYRAGEQAMALLVRAARLLGPRSRGGRLVVQTRLPRHPVLDAVRHADPARLETEELARRRLLRRPPVSAEAVVSGAAAEAFVERFGAPLGLPPGIEVRGPVDGAWLVRAVDHAALADALATVARPPGRLRVEVDPLRI